MSSMDPGCLQFSWRPKEATLMVLKYWGSTCSDKAFSSSMINDVPAPEMHQILIQLLPSDAHMCVCPPSSDQCTISSHRSSFSMLQHEFKQCDLLHHRAQSTAHVCTSAHLQRADTKAGTLPTFSTLHFLRCGRRGYGKVAVGGLNASSEAIAPSAQWGHKLL
jgi:hypothetical protein